MFDDVHFSVMLVTGIIFLVLIFVLNTILYKPIINFMDERNKSIKSDEDKVKQNSEDMQSTADELAHIHKSTREEIYQIKQNALDEAKQAAEELLTQKRQELEQKMNIFYSQLSDQKNDLEKELSSRLALFKSTLDNKLKNI